MDDRLILIKLGERVKELRQLNNMTQAELAIKSNLEKSRISRIESGQMNSTVFTVHKLSTALDVHIAELFK
ncbi:helix-turn-helix domain-containing protein [Ferruginibacter lapsinanis]|uniref:helix-turn-helix domain-containing protein n=1 Tax=Ferruginibacter lapsinanis TaxID=563172 RepID=UPI001E52B066|nr:helix-turn-helix transcriptional regulator [Ferruginibacter lapsinanis]UEG51229.1 helix-turn-helix domain-containing protein [Ferruginibacter lapsinanis]